MMSNFTKGWKSCIPIIFITTLNILFSNTLLGKEIIQGDTAIVQTPDDSYYLSNKRERFPVFGIYKENYIVTGASTSEHRSFSKYTTDVRFQTSWALRISQLKKVDLLATYTQQGIWLAYQKSSPMKENVFNPSFVVYWYLNPKTDILFGIEHRSNGDIGVGSRSENLIYSSVIYSPVENWTFGTSAWLGYYQKVRGFQWFRYYGYCKAWAIYRTDDKRLSFSLLVNPSHLFRNYNIEFNSYYRLSDSGTFLPSIFIQYRQGYGETMTEFYRYSSHIRIGFSLELKNGYNSVVR